MKGKKSGRGYVLAIEDDGIGMEPEDIERSNRRLAGTESYTVAPSRYLGHYVAGNLANRLGLEVRVQDSPARGTMATVTIPALLLETGDKAPVGRPESETFDARQLLTDADGASEDLSWLVEEPEYVTDDQGHVEPVTVEAGHESESDWKPEGDWSEELSGAVMGNGSDSSDEPTETNAEPTTLAGLPRRVPGAQRPDTEPVLARGAATETTDDTAPTDSGAFGFLSAFGSAVNPAADGPADGSPDQEDTDQ